MAGEREELKGEQSVFTTRELEILCYELEEVTKLNDEAKRIGALKERPKEDLYQAQIDLLRILMKRYEEGYQDQIPDQHEAEKCRRLLIAFLKARDQKTADASQDDDKEYKTLEEISERYQYTHSGIWSWLRTTTAYRFWPTFHLFRFTFLGIFLTLISVAGLPFMDSLWPGLGTFLNTWDYTAHMIFGVASTFYFFESALDLGIMSKAFYKAKKGEGWAAFKTAHDKGNRPARFRNATVWFIANLAGFLMTGGWWDSTSFAQSWAASLIDNTWNWTLLGQIIAAVTCVTALIHDVFHEKDKIDAKISEKQNLLLKKIQGKITGVDELRVCIKNEAALKESIEDLRKKGTQNINLSYFILGSISAFYLSAKFPYWTPWAAAAKLSTSWLALPVPYIAPVLGISSGICFMLIARYCLTEPQKKIADKLTASVVCLITSSTLVTPTIACLPPLLGIVGTLILLQTAGSLLHDYVIKPKCCPDTSPSTSDVGIRAALERQGAQGSGLGLAPDIISPPGKNENPGPKNIVVPALAGIPGMTQFSLPRQADNGAPEEKVVLDKPYQQSSCCIL